MKKGIFYFAVTGWLLGLLVHFLAVSGVDVQEKVPFVFVLHIGVFVAFIPAVLKMKKLVTESRLEGNNGLSQFKILRQTAPTWLLVIAGIGFVYAFVNFVFFMKTGGGATDIKNGQYILQSHGVLIKTLTEQEYHQIQASVLRGFSGGWLAFYGAAASILYPFPRLETAQI